MAAEGILTQILVQGFGGLLTNLATSYMQGKNRKLKADPEIIKRDLGSHFDATFLKCMNVKTILNGDQTSRTLQIYVDQTFKVRRETVDQYSLIESIRSGESIIVIGEGGGGKSMFMRYLWLSYFEKSDGKIPFFLELRNLNHLTHSNLSDFIFHSIIKSGSSIRQADFNEALRAGEFVVFLDGFDEINYDQRDKVQRMILDLREQNPKLIIVVTSRSDERFIGWDNFLQAEVLPLKKSDSRALIERSDYNPDLKKKFLAKFDALFDQHQDFLSNPLLAYMMLVTFSYNPDIPRRMFQFYEQSFEALYHRHDLSKGYKRKFHCRLDKYDFIRLISYLCLKTYYDEKVEFSKMELLEAIETVKKIESIDVSSEALVDDLVQSVCLLKIEGITYTFTHRSFQEYFAAYCISRVASRNLDQLFSRFSRRYSDRVLQMVADINPELFREKFLLPNREKFSDFFDMSEEESVAHIFATLIGAEFSVHARLESRRSKTKAAKAVKDRHEGDYNISLKSVGPMSSFYKAAISVAMASDHSSEGKVRSLDADFVSTARKLLASDWFRLEIRWENDRPIFLKRSGNGNKLIESDLACQLEESFRSAMMYQFLENRGRMLMNYVNREVAQYKSVSHAFDDLF